MVIIDEFAVFTARCTIVQSAVLRLNDVCPSVTLVDQDHIGWKSWKLIARTISLTLSLFVAQRHALFTDRVGLAVHGGGWPRGLPNIHRGAAPESVA